MKSSKAIPQRIERFDKYAPAQKGPRGFMMDTLTAVGRIDPGNEEEASDTVTDASLGREIFIRRTAGPSRVTIYRGSHETLPAPTFEWFEKHRKQ